MKDFLNILGRILTVIAFLFSLAIFISGVVFIFSPREKFLGFVLMVASLPLYFLLTRGFRWILTGEKVKFEEVKTFFQISRFRTLALSSVEYLKGVMSSIITFFSNLNTIIPKTFRGEYSLGRTYWLGGVLCGWVIVILTLPIIFVAYEITFSLPNLSYFLILIYFAMLLSLHIFFFIAINNSATNNRTRGFWGWLALIIYTLGLFQIIYQGMLAVGLRDASWSELEEGIVYENLTLPTKVDEITTLDEVLTNSGDRSLTYNFTVELNKINQKDFSFVKDGCEDMQYLFNSGVEKIVYHYTGSDDSINVQTLLPEDCS